MTSFFTYANSLTELRAEHCVVVEGHNVPAARRTLKDGANVCALVGNQNAIAPLNEDISAFSERLSSKGIKHSVCPVRSLSHQYG